jgi:hypothetical protein
MYRPNAKPGSFSLISFQTALVVLSPYLNLYILGQSKPENQATPPWLGINRLNSQALQPKIMKEIIADLRDSSRSRVRSKIGRTEGFGSELEVHGRLALHLQNQAAGLFEELMWGRRLNWVVIDFDPWLSAKSIH